MCCKSTPYPLLMRKSLLLHLWQTKQIHPLLFPLKVKFISSPLNTLSLDNKVSRVGFSPPIHRCIASIYMYIPVPIEIGTAAVQWLMSSCALSCTSSALSSNFYLSGAHYCLTQYCLVPLSDRTEEKNIIAQQKY